jgi:beta-lactamase class A
MGFEISRRRALLSAAACAGAWASGMTMEVNRAIAALEKRQGGRLGVAAWDTATGHRLLHRADERFAMCSTFKFIAAAAILKRVDLGKDHLDRWVEYGESDLLEYAPVSREHIKEGGMVLGDLCAAAVELSDNTAANLMLKILGGPANVTTFVRSLGDNITRLDSFEPAMNVVPAGAEDNTTTPAAMVGLLNTLVLGQALSADSRGRLEEWMRDARIGGQRLPAGLPAGWKIAHKTGTWSNQANDVGVVWPPDRAPVIVAAFYTRDGTKTAQRESVLRDVVRIVAREI